MNAWIGTPRSTATILRAGQAPPPPPGYCCRIWEHDRRDHQDAGYLRPILPLVFYQGPTGWQHSPQFADLFPAATRDWPWLPRFEHVLFDQTQISPAQAAGSVRARLLQLTMMHAFNRAMREARARMRPLLDDLEREGSGGQDDMKMFMHYIDRLLMAKGWARRKLP